MRDPEVNAMRVPSGDGVEIVHVAKGQTHALLRPSVDLNAPEFRLVPYGLGERDVSVR